MALNLLNMKAMFQDRVRQGLVSILWESSRVMQFMNFIPWNAMLYPYSEAARLPGVAFRSMNEDFAQTEGVTNPKVETLSIMGGKIRTDSVALDQKGPSVRPNRVSQQMEAEAKFFDKNFFKGDPTTNPKAFYGLRKRLAGTQLITNATNGAVPDHKKFIEALDAVEGDNGEKIIFCARNTRRGLSADVGAAAGGRNVLDVGKQLTVFEGARVVEIFKDEAENDIFTFDETCGASAICTSAYVVRFGGAQDERYVQGISGLSQHIMAFGPINYGAYLEDYVQAVFGLGLFSGYCAARIQGILKY